MGSRVNRPALIAAQNSTAVLTSEPASKTGCGAWAECRAFCKSTSMQSASSITRSDAVLSASMQCPDSGWAACALSTQAGIAHTSEGISARRINVLVITLCIGIFCTGASPAKNPPKVEILFHGALIVNSPVSEPKSPDRELLIQQTGLHRPLLQGGFTSPGSAIAASMPEPQGCGESLNGRTADLGAAAQRRRAYRVTPKCQNITLTASVGDSQIDNNMDSGGGLMPIPYCQTLIRPALACIAIDQPKRFSQVAAGLSDQFNLTDEERRKTISSAGSGLMHNRVAWARTCLKFAGALDMKWAGKGVFITTSRFNNEALEFVGVIEKKSC